MACSSHKLYHVHDLDPNHILTTFCSPDSDEILFKELILFPVQQFQKLLDKGLFRGGILIDFSFGPLFFHLLKVHEPFDEITVLESSDHCIQEMKRWINKEEEAFDWSHFLEHFPEVEGSKENWLKKEDDLRGKIKTICNWDSVGIESHVQQADCVISMYVLQHISEDKEAFRKNMEKLSSLIKDGGRFVMVGGYNIDHYSHKDERFHVLSLDDDFLRQTLKEVGLTIDDFKVLESETKGDVARYDYAWVFSAYKGVPDETPE